tara:strand:- start:702 stop:1508 length:807 start_codon:yes stop_codon:yes gene_type:complete
MLNKNRFNEILPSLQKICFEAGALQIKLHDTDLNYVTKENKTPVTDADIGSNKILTEGLRLITPEIPIISEEDYKGQDRHSCFWLIDPLDGTRNYMNKGNEFCICISLIHNDFPILGFIYSPITQDLYYSYKGIGAYLKKKNDQPTRLYTKKVNCDHPNIIYTSTSINENILHLLANKIYSPKFIKCSSALKFGYIASGQGCFYPRLGPTHEWDTAAGQSLIEEAGGVVVDKFMQPLRYNKNKTFINKEFFVISDVNYDWKSVIEAIF